MTPFDCKSDYRGGQWLLIERGCLAFTVIMINRERNFNFMKNMEFMKNRVSARHEGETHKKEVQNKINSANTVSNVGNCHRKGLGLLISAQKSDQSIQGVWIDDRWKLTFVFFVF